MSRSFKKNPVIKDKNRYAQKSGNRKFRRKSKSKLKQLKEDELPMSKSEVINDYDISDYKILNAGKYVGKGKKKRINK